MEIVQTLSLLYCHGPQILSPTNCKPLPSTTLQLMNGYAPSKQHNRLPSVVHDNTKLVRYPLLNYYQVVLAFKQEGGTFLALFFDNEKHASW